MAKQEVTQEVKTFLNEVSVFVCSLAEQKISVAEKGWFDYDEPCVVGDTERVRMYNSDDELFFEYETEDEVGLIEDLAKLYDEANHEEEAFIEAVNQKYEQDNMAL